MNSSVVYSLNATETHVGIVLRYFPETSRIVIFDRFLGKYKGICFSPVSAGSCIAYERSGRGNNTRIQVREVLYVPLIFARSHLTFLHQVLEVCDASLPLDNVDADIFALLMWLCAITHTSMTEAQQDLIFAKLFVLLGLHTTHSIVCDACIALLHTSSVDTMSSISLDSKCAEKLKSWLYYCLSEQLSEQCLKTRIFFKKE